QLSTYVGGLAVDAAGSLLIADTYNSRIRKVDSGGIIRTIAGNGKFGFGGDGGPAVAATLGHPIAVAVGTAGDLLIADSNSSLEATGRIRSVNPSGVINTLGGTGTVVRATSVGAVFQIAADGIIGEH